MCNRVCKVCSINKALEFFQYHSATGYYSKTCKDCSNKLRRQNFANKATLEGRILNKLSTLIRYKTCNKCKEEKEVNRNNFTRHNSRYSNICRVCNETEKLKNKLIKDNEKVNDRTIVKHSTYRANDFRKGLLFQLTKKFLEKALNSECVYCGFPANGVDRLDNNIGHTDENCVPCCTQCNHARNNYFTVEEMKIIGNTIREIKLKRK